MDWKNIVASIAPTLGTMLGGPLAGAAVSELSSVLLGRKDGTEDQINQALTNGSLTPDKIVQLRQIDKDHEEKMRSLDIDLAKLNQEKEIAYIADTQDARKYKDEKVFWMGVAVLMTFASIMAMSMYGCYAMLTGGIKIIDVATVGMVSGFLGTIIGYVAANAQQVVGYFFGSSAGSTQKSDAMADSFKQAFSTRQ